MLPANRNACAMYISVPLAISSMSKTCTKARLMLDNISTTAIMYWTNLKPVSFICSELKRGDADLRPPSIRE